MLRQATADRDNVLNSAHPCRLPLLVVSYVPRSLSPIVRSSLSNILNLCVSEAVPCHKILHTAVLVASKTVPLLPLSKLGAKRRDLNGHAFK